MFPVTLHHILVPTDFSEHSDRALQAAILLAQPVKARLTLLHAFLLPVLAADAYLGVIDLEQTLERDARAQLHKLAAGAGQQGVTCEIDAQSGTPFLEILSFIERKTPDLVVMSTHGRTGLRRVVLGSVAERVVQRSRSPVLVMPAHPA